MDEDTRDETELKRAIIKKHADRAHANLEAALGVIRIMEKVFPYTPPKCPDWQDCSDCGGTGRVRRKRCKTCVGTGMIDPETGLPPGGRP